MRSRCGFRMVLHPEDWKVAMPQAFNCPIVEVDMGHRQPVRAFHGMLVAFHSEPVVLRSNQYLSGLDLFNRMISPPVAIRHFLGRPAEGEPEQLVAEANAKSGD